jgi:glutamate synthase domain-containing protein 2
VLPQALTPYERRQRDLAKRRELLKEACVVNVELGQLVESADMSFLSLVGQARESVAEGIGGAGNQHTGE